MEDKDLNNNKIIKDLKQKINEHKNELEQKENNFVEGTCWIQTAQTGDELLSDTSPNGEFYVP